MKKNYFAKNLNKGFITLSVIFCALYANPAMAQKNIGWTGATNTDWSVATNWNYPAITSAATFVNSSATITLTVANSEIAVGDKLSGFGIPAGATVSAIDGTQKIISITPNTNGAAAAPGTNVAFTFAVPKPATGAPTIVDIALISNGANLTLPAGSYYLGGLTISNETGAETGSTLTIPADAEVFVETLTNVGVLVNGGNIINNGYLDIKSSLTTGNNNFSGAYGMTFGLPSVEPSVATEYIYSGSGTLKIDTSAGNNFSGGVMFNGYGVNAGNATYKMLFDGSTNFLLSNKKAANGSAATHAFRVIGNGLLTPCKIILGGAGFDLGDSFSGGINGLIGTAGPGVNVTIAPETTINVFSNDNNPSNIISMYAFGANGGTAQIVNKGTFNISGSGTRSAISISGEYNPTMNFENQGNVSIDMKYTLGNQAGLLINGFQNNPAGNTTLCSLINSGTMSINSPIYGAGAGFAIFIYTDGLKSPFANIDNSGTLTLTGANFSTGGRAFNPANLANPGSKINNSGIINTNQEFRAFYTTNTSTGKITFASTPDNTIKLATFSVTAATAAAIGTTYTDSNSNVHTVVVAKVGGTGTSLITHVAANAANPPVVLFVADPPVAASAITKTGAGAGDASIIFTGLTTNNNNALFQPTLNSGTINTNTGITSMTGITGITTPDATSVLSPGGDTGNGLVNFGEIPGDALTLLGTLKMQATASTTAGVDYDAMKLTGALDIVDISAAILDVTGIYIPIIATTLDIMTTNSTLSFEGAVVGEFASVIGLPAKWSVMYTSGLGGKVQLVFDPTLGTAQFANFKFSVYPNPAASVLNVSAAKNISKVELYNLLGQRVQSHTVEATQKQLDISILQKGVYLMEVTIDNTKQAYKIIKQ